MQLHSQVIYCAKKNYEFNDLPPQTKLQRSFFFEKKKLQEIEQRPLFRNGRVQDPPSHPILFFLAKDLRSITVTDITTFFATITKQVVILEQL